MSGYDGPVEILVNGEKVGDGVVHLVGHTDMIRTKSMGGPDQLIEGMRSWGGTIDATVDAHTLQSGDGWPVIRTPEGRTGDAIINGSSLKGSGEPPFDWD